MSYLGWSTVLRVRAKSRLPLEPRWEPVVRPMPWMADPRHQTGKPLTGSLSYCSWGAGAQLQSVSTGELQAGALLPERETVMSRPGWEREHGTQAKVTSDGKPFIDGVHTKTWC